MVTMRAGLEWQLPTPYTDVMQHYPLCLRAKMCFKKRCRPQGCTGFEVRLGPVQPTSTHSMFLNLWPRFVAVTGFPW